MESRRFRLAAVLPFSWEKADLYNELAFTRERREPKHNRARGGAARASAASESSPASERTVGQGHSGVRRVERQVIQCVEISVILGTEALASP